MHLNCQPTERKRLSCSPSGSRSLCSGETPTRSGRAAGMLAGRHFAAAALGAPRPRTGQRQYGRAHGGTQTAVAVSTAPHRSEAAPRLMLSEKASHGRRHTEQFRQKYMLRAQVWTHRREMRAQETGARSGGVCRRGGGRREQGGTHKGINRTVDGISKAKCWYTGVSSYIFLHINIPEVRWSLNCCQPSSNCDVIVLSWKYLTQFLSLMLSYFMYSQEEYIIKSALV